MRNFLLHTQRHTDTHIYVCLCVPVCKRKFLTRWPRSLNQLWKVKLSTGKNMIHILDSSIHFFLWVLLEIIVVVSYFVLTKIPNSSFLMILSFIYSKWQARLNRLSIFSYLFYSDSTLHWFYSVLLTLNLLGDRTPKVTHWNLLITYPCYWCLKYIQ